MKNPKLIFSFLALGFVLMFPALIAASVTDDDFEEDPYVLLCGEADRALAAGDWAQASARLEEALQLLPHSASGVLLINNLGLAYSMQGLDSLALARLNTAVESYPEMKILRSTRAKVLLNAGRDRDAFRDFDVIIALDSLDADARYYHGLMALYGGGSAVAEDDFEVLASLEPESLRTWRALATLYSLTGRPRKAVTYFEKLIDSPERAPEYYAALAGCYLSLGELSNASSTIKDGLKEWPQDPELFYYRAWLNRDRFHLDDARADAKRAIELGANPAKVKALFE